VKPPSTEVAVITAVPGLTAVTIPPSLTVAIVCSLVDHLILLSEAVSGSTEALRAAD